MFSINSNVNWVTGTTLFFLMFGQEPHVPLYTVVGLPQPELLEPHDFIKTRTIAIYRQLSAVRESYQAYFNQTSQTNKAKNPIGELPYEGKLVLTWSPIERRSC